MLFRRISYRIALQFTAFVFLLLIINGAVFLAVDVENGRRQTFERLARTSALVVENAINGSHFPNSLPPNVRDRIRLLDPDGTLVYSGWVFANVPFSREPEFTKAFIQNDAYVIMTTPVLTNGQMSGFVQIAEMEHSPVRDLPFRAFMYLLVSAGISVLTFLVGLFFARRSLKPAEQMVERLEQFTQDASHELRTPLAALSSSLDLALRNQKYREGIISAKEDLRDVSSLVERLLELARLDKLILQTEPVDLSLLVETTAGRQRPLAEEKHIAIETTIKPNVQVLGDPALLRQVITNLVSNAIKFSKPEGGTIRLTLTDRKLDIEDMGVGISKDAMVHIFDRFYQADTSRTNDGYGLGLALVKRIVELHGWSIAAKSKEGNGTTFSIRFSSQA